MDVVSQCEGKKICAKCGGAHDYSECGGNVKVKCCNSGGEHSAACWWMPGTERG